MKTMGSVFEPKANALNAVRLVLAVSVIVWHSFPLSGTEVAFGPLRQFLGEISVDGFFAISGYLILSSWKRNPDWLRFGFARILRIFPGFWVCLIITAFVVAPVATVIVTGNSYTQVLTFENLTYVLKNASLRIFQPRIGDTPMGVPFTDAWNGSLWTLWWEFLCYVGILVLGLLRAFRFRATVPILFLVSLGTLVATAYGPVDNYFVVNGARFGIMFTAGMLIEQYVDRIPLTRTHLGAAAAVVALSMFLPDYRLVGALFVAYVVLGAGILVKSPRARLSNDVSYGTYIYAFPLQQLLASAGVASFGVGLFALASIALTLPFAAASWYLVERNALKWKPPRKNDRNVQTMAVEEN